MSSTTQIYENEIITLKEEIKSLLVERREAYVKIATLKEILEISVELLGVEMRSHFETQDELDRWKKANEHPNGNM